MLDQGHFNFLLQVWLELWKEESRNTVPDDTRENIVDHRIQVHLHQNLFCFIPQVAVFLPKLMVLSLNLFTPLQTSVGDSSAFSLSLFCYNLKVAGWLLAPFEELKQVARALMTCCSKSPVGVDFCQGYTNSEEANNSTLTSGRLTYIWKAN